MSVTALAIGSIISGALSAVATMNAGKAAQYAEEAKAKQAELQGSIEAVNYKEQANESLKNLEKVLAANLARGFAGNMDPLSSGSTQSTILRFNMREGVNQFTLSRDNATMAVKMAKYQSDQHITAGQNMRKAANAQAFIQLGQGFLKGAEIAPGLFTGGATG